MIITLIGADFSKSNIGTLSSWTVLCELGAGATYTGPSSVEKNATFSATVTLNEGYEISSAGITITMGGTALDESYYSIVDNVITFTVESVTGSIVIKVPTLNINTGEEDVIPNYIFTITPDPISATVTLSATGYSTVSGTGSQSITVANGTEVNWSVSADGYHEKTGTWTANGKNETLPVALDKESSGGEPETPTNYTFTIEPDPPTAIVTLTASGYTQNGNSITVANGTKVNWSVNADGYHEKTGTWTANGSDESKTVKLNTKTNTPPASDAPSGNLASPLININMADGTNIGTGGATYNASAIMDGAFSNNTFTCSNATGAMTVPIDFITDKTSEFTAYMVFDSWEYSDARYQRFFRYKGDEPALYISHSYKMPTGGYTGAQHKLLNAGLKRTVLEYCDEDYWLEISEGAAVCMDMEALSKPLAVAIRNDGVRYSFWVNGKCISTQLLTGKPSSPDWSEFQIGSGDDSGYNLQSLTCSKLMIWNKPLSDEEMATLLPN